jgi:hypothetical protein
LLERAIILPFSFPAMELFETSSGGNPDVPYMFFPRLPHLAPLSSKVSEKRPVHIFVDIGNNSFKFIFQETK